MQIQDFRDCSIVPVLLITLKVKINNCFLLQLINIFSVEEILHFTQKDLIPENIMLLDMHDCLYIWIGKLSSREDQRLSIQMAIEYLQSDPAGRDMNIAIINIKQGKEPPTFIGLFPTWDRKCWKVLNGFILRILCFNYEFLALQVVWQNTSWHRSYKYQQQWQN